MSAKPVFTECLQCGDFRRVQQDAACFGRQHFTVSELDSAYGRYGWRDAMTDDRFWYVRRFRINYRPKQPIDPAALAQDWRAWCGDTAWSRLMEDFAAVGGRVVDWGGRPKSRSAIPLCFGLVLPDGCVMADTNSRQSDIRRAIALAKMMRREECPE